MEPHRADVPPVRPRHRTLPTSLRVVRAILRNPALRRVELAFLVFNTIEFGAWVAILLYAYAAIGPTSVGLVAVAQLLPSAFIAPFTASLADRFSRQRVLALGYLAQVVTFFATWLGMALGVSPVLVVLAATCVATAQSITRPTHGALVPSLARTPEELTAANGWSGAMEGMGMLFGPLIAAAILVVATPTAVFGIATAGCLVSVLLTARVPAPSTALASPEPADMADIGLLDGLRLVASHGSARLVVGILALRMVVVGALDVLFVLLALEVFDIGDAGAGLLNAALGLGVVIGGGLTFAFVGRQRLAPVLATAGLASGIALVAVGSGVPATAAAGLILVTGIGFAVCDVVGRTILQRVTPDLVLARVLGAVEGLSFAGLSLGAILAPLLVLGVGVQWAVVIVGLIMPAGLAGSWLGLRAMDRSVLVPVRALELLREAVIFAPLPLPQLEWLARQARWHTVEAGQVLIAEGDPGDAYYVLESGGLTVSQGGRQIRVCDARAEGVGEIALLRDVPRTATVTATAASVLLLIRRQAFLEVVAGHPPAREVAQLVVAGRSGVDPAS
jgi:MFS family permease